MVAHGGSSEWNAEVERLTAAETGGPIEVAFLMGPAAEQHRFQDAAARLVARGAERIVVLPLLVSSHSGHYEQIRWLAGLTETLDETMQHHLHMAGITRPTTRVPMTVAPGLDDAPELAAVLVDRARALAVNEPAQALFLVGHGPNGAEDYAAWMGNLRVVLDSVRARTAFADVRLELVRDDAPPAVRAEAVLRMRELIGLQQVVTGGQPVVVVPILMSRGRVSRETFVKDLDGLRVVYSGDPLLPHPALMGYVQRRVRDAVAAAVSTSPAP